MRDTARGNWNVLSFLLLFAAVGTVVPASHPTKAVSACSAVRAGDLERALGRHFTRGNEEVRGTDSTCDYGAGNGQVSVNLQRLQAPLDMDAEIASLRKEIEGSSVRMAPEFGGFYLDIEGAGTQLHIIRGRDYVMVSILGFGEAAQVSSAARQLAKIAVGRI